MSNRSNRLARETSPYLLQHANNPVDWYPWGEEAFARAREKDRPILLSIGYSACHWCHVMAHESFEDEEIAALMNDNFVNIKVDREERPDVDTLYMAAVQQLTGQGGWPLTVFLTPGGAPFHGGTYFPPVPRHGLPSFEQLLVGVSRVYRERRADVERGGRELRDALERSMTTAPPTLPLSSELLDAGFQALESRFDWRNGGFGGAPKFPQPMIIEFLLRRWKRTGDAAPLDMAVRSLAAISNGGIRDHLGGGFHRYSVDAEWRIPHFEKMLYDNALLARAHLHAYLATREEWARRVAEETLDYVLRDLRSPEGGFYSSEDADSEGEEGKFYAWDAAEVDALLEPEDASLFRACYGIEDVGDFEGRNVLRVARGVAEVAEGANVSVEHVEDALARSRQILIEARQMRVRPGRDEKILTAWNSMVLRSLAEAARALDRADYRDAARTNAVFLLDQMRPEGALRRSFKDGVAKTDAFLEDYALLADALVSLYQADFDPLWIREARSLADQMIERFWSDSEGMFFDAAADADPLLVRPRNVNDGATPSGTSAAAVALLRLGALLDEDRYERLAEAAMAGLAGFVARVPEAFGELLCAMDTYLAPRQEIAIVGHAGATDTQALLDAVNGAYVPDLVIAFSDPSSPDGSVHTPLLAGRAMLDGAAAAYVCRNFACRQPTSDPAELTLALD